MQTVPSAARSMMKKPGIIILSDRPFPLSSLRIPPLRKSIDKPLVERYALIRIGYEEENWLTLR